MKVMAWEAENTNGGSYKFYRCFVLDNGLELRQYGRIGAPSGQWRKSQHRNKAVAQGSAMLQIDKKCNGGYQLIHRQVEFEVPSSASQQMIADVFTARTRNVVPTPVSQPSQPETVTVDIDQIAERALMAIATASQDPIDATVEYAQLREEWVAQENAIAKARSYLDTLEQLVTMT